MTVAIVHDRGAREFSTEVEGHRAVLQYQIAEPLMTVTHTVVPAPIGERGIAAQLARAALDTARAEGWKVRPACSYVAAFMHAHPEYADLLADRLAPEAEKEHVDELLDEALEETFPASDAPSVGSSN